MLGGQVSMVRSIRVSLPGYTAVHPVRLAASAGSQPRGSVALAVPLDSANACVLAKDPLHSLADAAPALPEADGRLRSTHSLRQGDSNDDNLIEIVDYGLWIVDRSTASDPFRAPDARSNFNADAFVNNFDYALIAVGFFQIGDSCTPGAQGAAPRDRISVKELRRQGLGEVAGADLNADGWLDLRDVQMSLQGGHGAAPTPSAESEVRGW